MSLLDNILIAAAEGGIEVNTATAISIVGGLVAAISLLFKLLMSAKEREYARTLKELETTKENFEKLAAESLVFATQQANWAMQQRNMPPIVPVAPVVPRSQSPSTPEQRETARLATMVAQLAQIKLMMGMEATVAPPRAAQTEDEKAKEDRLVAKELQAPKPPSPADVKLRKAIAEVPEKTALKVIEKLDEQKEKP